MDFTLVDGYLLGDPVSKADVVSAFLAQRSPEPSAAPFYRALEAVGVRAADEAFVALRIVLGGLPASDERVRRLRALSGIARAAAAGDQRSLATVRKRDAVVLEGVLAAGTLEEAGAEARRAFHAELRA